MNCNEIKKLIPLYIKGMAEKEISTKIEKHLKKCTDCAKVYKFEKEVDKGLNDFFANMPEISVTKPKTKNQKQKSTTVYPFLKWATTAVAVIAISVSAIFVLRGTKTSPLTIGGKYVEIVKDVVTKNVEINNVKYVCSKHTNVELKELKENIVWLTVRN
jgi:predicted anti-sigma-YlaC factor YlaD